MSTAMGRRLQVLTLLQSSPGTTAAGLAARLGTTERTARRDVAALRDLGYRVDAAPGRYGGYTLGPGTSPPPPVLDADEALAAALGLRAASGVHGLDAAAATALAKLVTALPTRHRTRLAAVAATMRATEPPRSRDSDPATFTALALACRAREAVRLTHHRDDAHSPAPSRARDTQPHQLVSAYGRWYLVACDRGSTTWRTYALDRVTDAQPLGLHLPTPHPPRDPAALLAAATRPRGRHHVKVRVHTSSDLVRQLVSPTTADVHADDEHSCVLELDTDDLDWAARWLVHLDLDVDVLAPPALHQRLHDLGTWLIARYSLESGPGSPAEDADKIVGRRR
ncbi:helix-turn-helix transcriptional regulator [Pseudokineococcus sp. 1T1Z-3]|uniref:helix-turn-helix transcriptional regulator n=1 Tax=Pseudokineococcus sp. 1T1Z-3 TaxID=3132745 RepID=UPI0030B7D32D